MNGVIDVSQTLVGYDRALAELVLRLVAAELGVEADDVAELHAELVHLVPLEAGDAKSTLEWKGDFAKFERLRGLGVALAAELLER